jgi:hypothetical protein
MMAIALICYALAFAVGVGYGVMEEDHHERA